MMKNNFKNLYKISKNEDWRNLNIDKENIIDISNNSYFGFRSMEKKVKKIIYDISLIDNLVRMGKESKKFPLTTHVLILNEKTLSFDSKNSEETFLKNSISKIEELIFLNKNIKIDFLIISKLDVKFIYNTLKKIYNI